MFEEWSAVMSSILDHVGIEGFLANREAFYGRSDSEGSDIRGFLIAWWEAHRDARVKVSTLFAIANAPDSTIDISAKTEQAQRVRLGKLLCTIEDRHYQLDASLTVRVVRTGVKEKGAVLWRLENGESDSQNGETERQRAASSPADSPSAKSHNHAKKQDVRSGGSESGESVSDTQRIQDHEELEMYVSGSVEIDSPPSADSSSAHEGGMACAGPPAGGGRWGS
jgi:hypothetical protein